MHFLDFSFVLTSLLSLFRLELLLLLPTFLPIAMALAATRPVRGLAGSTRNGAGTLKRWKRPAKERERRRDESLSSFFFSCSLALSLSLLVLSSSSAPPILKPERIRNSSPRRPCRRPRQLQKRRAGELRAGEVEEEEQRGGNVVVVFFFFCGAACLFFFHRCVGKLDSTLVFPSRRAAPRVSIPLFPR